MSTNRLLSVLAAAVLVVMAIVAVRGGSATSAVASRGQDLSDYFQRHPGGSVAIARTDLSDYFLRHPASAIPANSVASDWFDRHPESLKAVNAVDLSDYYQRHPSLAAAAEQAQLEYRRGEWYAGNNASPVAFDVEQARMQWRTGK